MFAVALKKIVEIWLIRSELKVRGNMFKVSELFSNHIEPSEVFEGTILCSFHCEIFVLSKRATYQLLVN